MSAGTCHEHGYFCPENDDRGCPFCEIDATKKSISDTGDALGRAQQATREVTDPVDHPPHYTAHPSGVECIQVTEHMGFCLGNAVKYIWRADLKNDAIEDLKKARWYIEREIALREKT